MNPKIDYEAFKAQEPKDSTEPLETKLIIKVKQLKRKVFISDTIYSFESLNKGDLFITVSDFDSYGNAAPINQKFNKNNCGIVESTQITRGKCIIYTNMKVRKVYIK